MSGQWMLQQVPNASPLTLPCPASRSCCCLSWGGRAQGGVQGGRGAEGQHCTHAHTHSALTQCTHTGPISFPQALWCSELTALDTWAPGLSCPQSKHHFIPLLLLLCSPGAPGAQWDTPELHRLTGSQPQANPSLGSLVLQPYWKSSKKYHNVNETYQLVWSDDEVTHLLFLLALYKNVPVLACLIHLLVLTDTFSSVASFQVSNDLVGWIYLNICQVFISTDHQSWVPAQTTELGIAWRWFQQSVQLCPCLLQRLRLCPWAQITPHQGLQSVVEEQLVLNARKQQILMLVTDKTI